MAVFVKESGPSRLPWRKGVTHPGWIEDADGLPVMYVPGWIKKQYGTSAEANIDLVLAAVNGGNNGRK
ncbi:MAG: hypothetical protein AB7H77_09625 [Bdellovibrionales bacterium]